MNSKQAVIGMRVISDRYGKMGTVTAILQSPLQPRVQLLRILVDGERRYHDWHPSHWEPMAFKERGHE